MNIVVFFVIYVLQLGITWPTFWRTCKGLDIHTFLLYMGHHAFDVFLFWSFLFLNTRNEYMIHILLVTVVLAHWAIYNNKCILTVYMNRFCGYNEGDWLDSLKNRLGLRNTSEYFHFIWLGVLVVYDVFLLV